MIVRKNQDKSAQALERAKQAGDPKKEAAAQKAYEKDENKAEKADNEYPSLPPLSLLVPPSLPILVPNFLMLSISLALSWRPEFFY